MKTVRLMRLGAMLFLAFGALGAAPSGSSFAIAAPVPRVQTVLIRNFAFEPAVLTISPGTTVTWTNADEDPHAVVANDKSFRSTALDTGGRYSFTFTRPGDYGYFCSLHPHMTAHIIVKPS